jgi:hypothetical protein
MKDLVFQNEFFDSLPTDMENMPPEKITDIGYIRNSNVYFEYTAYKNWRYRIYSKAVIISMYMQFH